MEVRALWHGLDRSEGTEEEPARQELILSLLRCLSTVATNAADKMLSYFVATVTVLPFVATALFYCLILFLF